MVSQGDDALLNSRLTVAISNGPDELSPMALEPIVMCSILWRYQQNRMILGCFKILLFLARMVNMHPYCDGRPRKRAVDHIRRDNEFIKVINTPPSRAKTKGLIIDLKFRDNNNKTIDCF